LIARVSGADSDLIAATADQRPALAKAAAQFTEEDLTRFFQILLQTDDDLRRKPDPRVHLEMGLLRLINAQRLAPMEELLAELRSGAPAGVASAGGMRSSAVTGPTTSAQQAPAARSFSTTPVYAPASQSTFTPPSRAAAPSFGASTAAAAAAPARAEIKAVPVAAPTREELKPALTAEPSANVAAAAESEPETEASTETAATETRAAGITQKQIAEIKAAIQAQQKFLGEIMNQGSRWELEGAELRIYFSADKRAFAEMMEGRDSMEKVRACSSKVLGRVVRVCAKVEAVAAAAPHGISGTQELREQFERDPMVRSMLQRFGGKISEVKWRQEES
jgi:DNA polymerase-3 subunit gamma/tau